MKNIAPITDTSIRLPHWGLQALWKLVKTVSNRADNTHMEEKRNRLDSLLEWAEATFGPEISHRIVSESPLKEADFWKALNKARAAHKQKYQSHANFGISRFNS